MTIRVGQVKVVPEKGDLRQNSQLLHSVLAELAAQRPDVVVTPEGFLDGYVVTEESVTRSQLGQYAICPQDSEYAQAVGHWARANHCWVVFGCARLAGDGIYNSALIYDREGQLVGIYDKTHLQKWDQKYTPGQDLPVFKSDFGLFGVLICADRRWPETVRTLALKGARVIFNPTYGQHCDRNLAMMRTRSFESEIFIAFTHARQALITSPAGEVLCNNQNEHARFAITEIDLADADCARGAPLAHLRDRRPDLYHLQ